jgi:hypothetical protein
MSELNPRVIVVVEGGVVSAVFADRPINVDVLDHDNWEVTDRNERQREWEYFAGLLEELQERKLLPQI